MPEKALIRKLLYVTLLMFVLSSIVSACSLVQAATPLAPPTATTVKVSAFTPIPTLSRLYQPVSQSEMARITEVPVTATVPADIGGCQIEETQSASTIHRVEAILDYEEKTVDSRQRITYRNDTGEVLDDIVLNIEPNRWANAFTINEVKLFNTADGTFNPGYTLTGRRLYIELPEPLEEHCTVEFEITSTLDVPMIAGGVEAFKGYLGYSPRQINLGHWLPVMAPRINGEWLTRQAMFVGEQEVVEKADWDVTLSLVNAPETVSIAGAGIIEELDDNRWHFTHQSARDLTLSIGDGFDKVQTQTESGTIIEVYSFSDAQIITDQGIIDSANHALNVALRSFESYESLFGDYPYERVVIVQGDFPDGMEFSGLVFVSTDWFKGYTGDPASFLTLITVHEVSHQWWYAQVGNDPAVSPWLDEALATYSEYIFLEEFYPHLKDWWWEFRVRSHNPQGFVDSTVYEFTTIRDYINAVYLRGVSMLHAIRIDIGTEAFFELLRAYADTETGKIATPEDFWALMTPEQIEKTKITRQVFLRRPNVVSSEK